MLGKSCKFENIYHEPFLVLNLPLLLPHILWLATITKTAFGHESHRSLVLVGCVFFSVKIITILYSMKNSASELNRTTINL